MAAYYTEAQRETYRRRLAEINGTKARQGRRKDVVVERDFNALLLLAEVDSPQVRDPAVQGIRQALLISGVGVIVTALLRRARRAWRGIQYALALAGEIRANVGLISSVPKSRHGELARAIWRLARREGGRRLSMRRLQSLLENEFGVEASRARLIAMDQARKLSAAASRAEQEAAGITRYLWWTMLDNRVRPHHQTRHGKQYDWRGKGPHPGEEINCRCVPIPVISGRRGFGVFT